MQELRELARTGEIAGFISEPPPNLSTETVHGVNLVVDHFWLRYYRAFYAARAEESVFSGSYRSRRLFGHKDMDFEWRPTGWADHCQAWGYPRDAHPVVIQIHLRNQGFVKVGWVAFWAADSRVDWR